MKFFQAHVLKAIIIYTYTKRNGIYQSLFNEFFKCVEHFKSFIIYLVIESSGYTLFINHVSL